MSDEDKKYAEPKTNENNEINLDKGAPTFLGFPALPGELYTSGKICAQCPKCSAVGCTVVESTWSVKSCLFCYYYGGYWACWQLLKGKDFIPKDAVHKCSSCSGQMAHYQSCEVAVAVSAEEKK